MPSYHMSRADAAAIVAYLKSLKLVVSSATEYFVG